MTISLEEEYTLELAKTASAKKELGLGVPCRYETGMVKKLSGLTDRMAEAADALEEILLKLGDIKDVQEEANVIRDMVLVKMCELRLACDEAETVTAKKYWPFPTYGDLLFSVK